MAQAIRDEVIEELLQGYVSPEDLLGEEGLFKQLKKRLLERALGAELSEHLGYEKGDPGGRGCPGRCFRHLRPTQTARQGRRKAPPKAGVFATLCRRPLAGAEREPRRQDQLYIG
jgi:hypothetical protein